MPDEVDLEADISIFIARLFIHWPELIGSVLHIAQAESFIDRLNIFFLRAMAKMS